MTSLAITVRRVRHRGIQIGSSLVDFEGDPQLSPDGVSQLIRATLLNRSVEPTLPKIGFRILESSAILGDVVFKTTKPLR